ncbi:hypothetical protein Pmani_002081 [Petrolisthes manimaculis]|uniref:Uncharacterized protein n=1 Tax=Petrolisthes manimaculis TaxID=1843537 RepID=A0AAE1QJ91_9EUCA|nr:hypothetical protein Pmani_002081 [Petrolisthes manimaculis]
MEVHRLRLVVPSTLYMVVVVVVLVLVVRAGVTTVIDRRMMVAMDTTFDISLASQTFNLSSSCECKMRCLVLPSCISWSLVITPSAGSNNNNNNTRDNNSECRISNQGPEDLALTVQTHAVYGYKLSGIKSDIGVITGPDHLLYMKSSLYLTLQGMRDHCMKIPGFRLVILKTPVQFKFAKEYLATVAPEKIGDISCTSLQYRASTTHEGYGNTETEKVGDISYSALQYRASTTHEGYGNTETEKVGDILCSALQYSRASTTHEGYGNTHSLSHY